MDWKKMMEPVRYFLYIPLTLIYFVYQVRSNLETDVLLTNVASFLGLEVIIIEGVIHFLFKFLEFLQKRQGPMKLTEDYTGLMLTYKRVSLIEYADSRFPGVEIAFRSEGSKPFQFDFNPDFKDEKYAFPEQIKDKSAELMKVHDRSRIYNSSMVRLKNCEKFDNTLKLTYSSTTYYDSLTTNYVMDYPLEKENGHTVKSVRQIYEPGPFLSSLSESKLSNHLGFNGFVELADGYIIFVLRSASVSVGKRRWNPSVSASYKTEVGLNDQREMSRKCMGDAIRREIADELKIAVGKNERLEDCIFAFYRDLVEGGKPHFVFYYRIRNPIWTKDYFEEHFRKETRKRKAMYKWRKMTKEDKSRFATVEDGEYFAFFSRNKLKNSVIRSNQLVTPDGRMFRMQSDASISLALLMKYFNEAEIFTKTLVYDWLRKNIRVELAQMPAEKRFSSDPKDIEKLAKILIQILRGEISFDNAAYASDDFITPESLAQWKDKAEMEFRRVLENAPAWIYKESKSSRRGNLSGTR